MHGLRRFLPPLVWMGVIATLSSDFFAAPQTESWFVPLLAALLPEGDPALVHGLHAALRKLGHVVEYGILATLWFDALRPGRPPHRATLWTLGIAAAYAVADEARQGLTAHRSAAVPDVLLDTAGAILAVAWLQSPGRPGATLARLGRWAALLLAGASLTAAAVDWQLDLPPWDLLVAALGAAIAAWAFQRIERRQQGSGPVPDRVGPQGRSPR